MWPMLPTPYHSLPRSHPYSLLCSCCRRYSRVLVPTPNGASLFFSLFLSQTHRPVYHPPQHKQASGAIFPLTAMASICLVFRPPPPTPHLLPSLHETVAPLFFFLRMTSCFDPFQLHCVPSANRLSCTSISSLIIESVLLIRDHDKIH